MPITSVGPTHVLINGAPITGTVNVTSSGDVIALGRWQASDSAPPFKVGDRVRLTSAATHHVRFRVGTVRAMERIDPVPHDPNALRGWRVFITRDGASLSDRFSFVTYPGYKLTPRLLARQWELIPLTDWSADEVIQALADAVKRGDVSAWRPLVDRAQELLSEMGTG